MYVFVVASELAWSSRSAEVSMLGKKAVATASRASPYWASIEKLVFVHLHLRRDSDL
jgi:hypothetical protein